MNKLKVLDNEIVTMESREIALLVEKQHSHICRDIRKQLSVQGLPESNYGSGYIDKNNQERICYNLDYEQLMILLTGYSVALRAKVVKRWNELEQKTREVEIPSQLQLAKQVVVLLEEKEKLLLKSKVADELAGTKGLYLPSVVGKIVCGHPNLFCKYLIDNKIMFRRHEKLLPYAKYADKYFKVKVSMFKGKSIEQSYFTARGLAWVKAKYIKANNLLALEYLNG